MGAAALVFYKHTLRWLIIISCVLYFGKYFICLYNNLRIIIKRLTMINRQPTGTFSAIKTLLTLVVIFLTFEAFSHKVMLRIDNKLNIGLTGTFQ